MELAPEVARLPLADLAIAGLVAMQAWQGRRSGLVLGGLAVIVLLAGVLLALIFEEPAAAMLDGIVPLSGEMLRVAAFFLVVSVVNAVAGLTALRLAGAAMRRQGRSARVTTVDNWLGVLPGAVRGIIYAGGLVFQARMVLPPEHELRGHLERSLLAVPVQQLFEIVTPFARLL